MGLAAGAHLGRYEILSPLGAGGMGEVYLAEDTTLGRRVALKVLPAEVARSAERMQRFVREAKAASALNHPAIAHIYEIGEAAGTSFIAMEFVEGVTLREKIHDEKGALGPLLKHLAQVADGLAKAHAAGIVHRDLKPDNVMISRDGYAKILDFGLAKLVGAQAPAGGEADSEAATAVMQQPLSAPGMIMGTPGYMSPEQARGGREVDQRSDIFSFGCILYEAATRRQPFAGETAVDSLHKIIHAQPPPLKDYNADAPADLQRIVRRCLAKDPEERYQTIKDVAIELRELRREMEGAGVAELSVTPEASAGARVSNPGDPTAGAGAGAVASTAGAVARQTSSAEYLIGEIRKHKAGAVAALSLFVAALAGAGYGIYRWGAEPGNPAVSFQSAKFARLTGTGKVLGVGVSPDGKYVAHVVDEGGRQSLWVRQTATPSNVQIVAPAEASYRGLTFSPDGDYVYYTVYEKGDRAGTLYQVPALGGAGRKLLTGISSAVTFSPDAKRMAYFRRSVVEGVRDDALLVANADGTGEKTLATARGDARFQRGTFSSPAWSPDGRTIACPFGKFSENEMTVAAVSVETGEVEAITPPKWFAVRQVAWLADGSGLLFNAQDHSSAAPYQIWQASYPGGETRRVTNDLINYRSFSLTPDSNTLATVQGEFVANIWVMPANDSARAAQITSGRIGHSELGWTPDGRLVYNSNANGSVDIYLIDSRGGEPKQLTANAASNSYPAPTRDGRYIVFMSDRAGRPNVWRMDADGGNQKQLTGGYDLFPHVSPDGRWIVYQSLSGENKLRKVSIDGGQFVELTDYVSGTPAFSPDGSQIACTYQERAGAPAKIAVIPAEGGRPLKTFPLPREGEAFANVIRWTPDGRDIVYARVGEGVSNLWAQPVDGRPPRQITSFTAERIFWFDYSHDGKQLALTRGTQAGDVVLIKDFR
jgi:eukaryotic-like serine/threonine-protein kinase